MPTNPKFKIQGTKLLLIVGPTASGKTAVALELCDLLNGEILSADSALVYRGLDIGSAKPTQQDQARAPHHLIDICDPDQEYSAAQWAQDATQRIEEIAARGAQPIIVGGTGFYINALLRPNLLASAPPNLSLRAELEELAQGAGPGVLHARLTELDARAAARLHSNDTMRVVRAIEVAVFQNESQIKSKSKKQTATEAPAPRWEYSAFALEWPRELLYERINARVDAMLEGGFLEELQTLLRAGFGESPALKSLGYKQMRAALENEMSLDNALEIWKRETRRYAKRQGTWFRHQLKNVRWIAATQEKGAARGAVEIAHEIADQFQNEFPDKNGSTFASNKSINSGCMNS
jgi:tRNA dimethylallyltransferase